MKHNSAIIFLSLSISGLLMAGCKHRSDKPTEAPPVRVEALAIVDSDYSEGRTFSGTVASASTATVSFSVAGTIEALYADEGQRVGRGQLLGKLKSGDYVNADNIAQAELAEAQDGYERLKKLHDANALPDVKWVEIQQKLKQARNAADISRRALEETSLHSPMSGVVSRKIANPGQNVAPIEPVYEIVSTENLTIDISVPENEVGRFAVGQRATVRFENMAPIEGKVTQKSVVADPLTRSYKIKVSLPGASGGILPGMIGNVAFEGQEKSEKSGENTSIMLPSQAVNLSDDNRTFVWIVKDGKAEQRFVKADELVATGVLISEGLAAGDTVVVAGMQKVGRGSAVDIVNLK